MVQHGNSTIIYKLLVQQPSDYNSNKVFDLPPAAVVVVLAISTFATIYLFMLNI